MHIGEFAWAHPKLIVLHVGGFIAAVFHIGLSIGEGSCFFGRTFDNRQFGYDGACDMSAVAGVVSLLASLTVCLLGVCQAEPPKFHLSRTFSRRATLVSGLMLLLWCIVASILTAFLKYTCDRAPTGNCLRIPGYETGRWLLATSWTLVALWFCCLLNFLDPPHRSPRTPDTELTSVKLAPPKKSPPAPQPKVFVDRQFIYRSGTVRIRQISLADAPMGKWEKKFMVLTPGQLTLYRTSEDLQTGNGKAMSLKTGTHVVDRCFTGRESDDKFGLIFEPHRDRYEIAVFDNLKDELPNLSPDAQEPATRSVDRKAEWILAMSLAIPTTIFGVPLTMAVARGRNGSIPDPLAVCFEWLDMHGLDDEGLYRVPGAQGEVTLLINQFNSGEDVILPETESASNVASTVIQFLSRLPENLFTDIRVPQFERAALEQNVPMMAVLLSQLPRVNFCVIRALVQHLEQVTHFSHINQMTADTLSMCVYTSMGPTIHLLLKNCETVFAQAEPTRGCDCPNADLDGHQLTCPSSFSNVLLFPRDSRSRSSRRSSAADLEQLRHQLEALQTTNAALLAQVQAQRQADQAKEDVRARYVADKQRSEREAQTLLQQMVELEAEQQRQHSAQIAELERQIAALKQR